MGDTKSESLALVQRAGNLDPAVWNNDRINAVLKYVGESAGLTEPHDIAVFLSTAQRYALDPLVGEIFAFPSQGKIKVFAGRDGFLKAASRSNDYVSHDSGTIWSKDDFGIVRRFDAESGENVTFVEHKINGIERGDLLGAFCIVRGRGGGTTVTVRRLVDYAHLTGNSRRKVWQQYPEDMVENRCIAAALRRQIPLAGLGIQGEEEDGSDWHEHRIGQSTRSKVTELKSRLGLDEREPEVLEATVVNPREVLDSVMEELDVPMVAVEAWIELTASVSTLQDDESVEVVINSLREAPDEFLADWARVLMSEDDSMDMIVRMDMETALANRPPIEEVRAMIERLKERET